MLKLKNKNGITLIALIITIIVMLILVGVTITMALGDGGIIAEAKKAKNQMEAASEADVLQELALGAIGTNGVVDFNKLDEKISQSELFTGTNGTYTSQKGNTFTVDQYGNVEIGTGGGSGTVTESRLGAYVTYKGVTWRVLKDDSSGVELLAANAMGSATGNFDHPSSFSGGTFEHQLAAMCQSALNEEITGEFSTIRNVSYEDISLMRELGLMEAGNEYFVAHIVSTTDENDSELSHWYAHYVDAQGNFSPIYLFVLQSPGIVTEHKINPTTITKPVRPIYILGAGALDNASGSGTSGQPYVIAE